MVMDPPNDNEDESTISNEVEVAQESDGISVSSASGTTEAKSYAVGRQITSDLCSDILDFYIYAMDIHCLPQTVALDLTSRMEAVIRRFCDTVSDSLNSSSSEGNMTEFWIEELKALPRIDFSKQKIYDHLHDTYKFKLPFQIHCSNSDTFSYIPISDYITGYFKSDNEKFEKNDVFLNSVYYKSHIQPCEESDDVNVHLLLYSDEFEICNPSV